MIQRQTERAVENLNLSDEESAILVPKIKAILQHRMQQRQTLRPFAEALRTAVDGKDDTQIKSTLEALKAKRNEQKTTSETLGKELVELLTVRQEAQLTIAGVVNSDGGFGGFGGRRGRAGGGEGRRGNRPNRPAGNQ
jgi:K+/H+ antiporter YhaU regulatory subunit KhtT